LALSFELPLTSFLVLLLADRFLFLEILFAHFSPRQAGGPTVGPLMQKFCTQASVPDAEQVLS